MVRDWRNNAVLRRLPRLLTTLLVLLGYWLAFLPVFARIGPPAFMLSLVPCITAGVLLGVRGASVVIVATIALDRSFALTLGMPPSAELVAAITVKLALGLGSGVITDSARRVRKAKRSLEQEIAVRHRVEQRLRQSEALHRALVQSLGEGVGMFDEQDRFLFANQALAATLNTTPIQTLGKHFSDFVDDESRERVAQGRARGPSSPSTYEVVLDGEDPRLLLVTETRFDASGDSGADRLRVVRDLTERVKSERRQQELERELQQSQALQGLAVLAGGVAHDFNNLLSGIVGNAELGLVRMRRHTVPELQTLLEEIRQFAREAGQLSRQMLAYAGRDSMTTSAVDVSKEVREALKLLRSTVESRSRLDLDLGKDIPEVRADRLQLRQVITNLVLNAVESMPESRGTIKLVTACTHLDAAVLAGLDCPKTASPGEYVRIEVQDDGPGIPEEMRHQIFQPFFSTKAQGRGLGLAAAFGIIRSHRGWIDVHSKVGEGTKFTVWLPVPHEWLSRTQSERVRIYEPIETRSILLIDDEPAVRLVTGRLLKELGRDVLTAEDGPKGLELFQRHQREIDLVLLDLTMPGLSGPEVLTELQKLDPNVRVVITSGFQPSGAAELLKLPGVIGFLEKPHTLGALEALLGGPVRCEPQGQLRARG